MLLALGLSSCNKDSDESWTYLLEVKTESGATNADAEKKIITEAFEKALGGEKFVKEGDLNISDLTVINTCQAVQDRLDSNKWNGSYTVSVYNLTSGGMPVYRHTFASQLEIKPEPDDNGDEE